MERAACVFGKEADTDRGTRCPGSNGVEEGRLERRSAISPCETSGGNSAAKTSEAVRQIVPNVKKVGKMPMRAGQPAGEQAPQRPHAEEGHRVEAHHAPRLFSSTMVCNTALLAAIWATMAKPVTSSRTSAGPEGCGKGEPGQPQAEGGGRHGDHLSQPDDALAGGQEEACRQGPDAQRRGQQAQRVRAAVQDLAWPAPA